MIRGVRRKASTQKKMDDFIPGDDIFSPEVGLWGKTKLASEFGVSNSIENRSIEAWRKSPDETFRSVKDLTLEVIMDRIDTMESRFFQELNKLEGKFQLFEDERKEMDKEKLQITFPETRSEEALQSIIESSKKHRIKNKKEFDEWMDSIG